MNRTTASPSAGDAVDSERQLARLSVLTFLAVASLLAFTVLAREAAIRDNGLLAAAFVGLAVSSLLLLGRALLSAVELVRDRTDDIYWLPPETPRLR